MRMTLREFARSHRIDAGNLSRIERSKVLPSAPMALYWLRTYGFERMGQPWQRAVNAYCKELVAEARSELERKAD